MTKLSAKYVNSPTINVMLPDGINVRIDPVADVRYIKVREAEIAGTREERDGILVDFAKNKSLIGISILHPKKVSIARTRTLRRNSSHFSVPGISRIHPSPLAMSYVYA